MQQHFSWPSPSPSTPPQSSTPTPTTTSTDFTITPAMKAAADARWNPPWQYILYALCILFMVYFALRRILGPHSILDIRLPAALFRCKKLDRAVQDVELGKEIEVRREQAERRRREEQRWEGLAPRTPRVFGSRSPRVEAFEMQDLAPAPLVEREGEGEVEYWGDVTRSPAQRPNVGGGRSGEGSVGRDTETSSMARPRAETLECMGEGVEGRMLLPGQRGESATGKSMWKVLEKDKDKKKGYGKDGLWKG